MKYNISKLDINKDQILNLTSELSLWKYYCSNFIENQRFYSEFYPDSNPGCFIFFNQGKGLYYDFGEPEHQFDIFSYIQRKYNLTFVQALQLINNDFNLKLGWSQGISKDYSLGYPGVPSLKVPQDNYKTEIKIKIREWSYQDKEFWKDKYNINTSLLKQYNVFPISHYWIIKTGKDYYKEYIYTCKSISYAYWFGSNNFKIYSPYEEQYKWHSNLTKDKGIIQGYHQLPDKGEIVIITSSLKDVLCWKTHGFNSVAPSSEAEIFSEAIIGDLKTRFKNVYLNMDSDEDGLKYADKWFLKHCELIDIKIPLQKDISDYTEVYGFDKTKELIEKIMYEKSNKRTVLEECSSRS